MAHPAIPLFKVFMADSVKEAVTRVLYSGYIGEGPEVVAFERELAQQFGFPHVLTLNSGTSALHLAYHMAIDGEADAEIITTPMTCTATNMPIINNGARIVWADVEPLSGNIDPDQIEALLSERTRAIVMVHWGGNPCDIDRILEIGRRNGIPVIEDAAHALGATYAGLPIGRHSDFVAFSFQAIKHVTSVDGGCLACNSEEADRRGRLLRWYGIDRTRREVGDNRCEIDVLEAGYKFHMNDVSAAVGRENLKALPWILDRHRENARFYDAAFATSNAITVAPENGRGQSSYWLYTLHLANRDEVMRKLLEEGVGASKVHGRNDVLSASGGTVIGTLTNSRFTSANGGVVASTGGAQINVDASSLVNNNIAFSVASGSIMRVSNNDVYNNATNFSIAAGGSILSAGNNRMSPGGATVPSGAIPLQ